MSTRVLLRLALAVANDAPHTSAVSVADALGVDLDLVRSVLALLVRLGHVHPTALVLPRRWLHRMAVPILDPDPARPLAEEERHARDLDVYAELLARARLDLHPRAGTHLPSERGLLTGRARRDVLARLRKILGLSFRAYLKLHRRNLCPQQWSRTVAMARANDLRHEVLAVQSGPVLVLLGRSVSEAFRIVLGMPRNALQPFSDDLSPCGLRLVTLPHPSGLNRAWNTKAAVDQARAILSSAVPSVPWGDEDADLPPPETT